MNKDDIQQCKQIVSKIIREYPKDLIQLIREDLNQEACIAYLKAKQGYKEELGAFKGYLYKCIYNQLRVFFRQEFLGWKQNNILIKENWRSNLNIEDYNIISTTYDNKVFEINPDIEKTIIFNDFINQAYNKLLPKTRQYWLDYFTSDLTNVELCVKYNISNKIGFQRIRDCNKRIKKKLELI